MVLTSRAGSGRLDEGHLSSSAGVLGPDVESVLGGVDQSVHVGLVSSRIGKVWNLLLKIAQIKSTDCENRIDVCENRIDVCENRIDVYSFRSSQEEAFI